MVAQGVLAPGNVIQAKEVLAKHDEKYTPPEIEEAMKENHSPEIEAAVKENSHQSVSGAEQRDGNPL